MQLLARIHYILYTVHCTLHNELPEPITLHKHWLDKDGISTLGVASYNLDPVHCTVYTVHCRFYILHSYLYFVCTRIALLLFTLENIKSTFLDTRHLI